MITDFLDFNTPVICGIYGLLGGGKTLTSVEIALEFLRRGFPVASNVQLLNLGDLQRGYTFISDFAIADYWQFPQGAPRGSSSPLRSCIVVDEVAEFFDQNSFASPLTKNFLSWLRHSSKRGQFVFLVVQHPDFMAKALRKLVGRWINCVDMAQFQIPVLGFRIPFAKHFVARFVFDKLGNRISHGFNFVNKYSIGQYYDTSQSIALLGRSEIVEPRRWDRFPLWLVVLLFYLMFIFWHT